MRGVKREAGNGYPHNITTWRRSNDNILNETLHIDNGIRLLPLRIYFLYVKVRTAAAFICVIDYIFRLASARIYTVSISCYLS